MAYLLLNDVRSLKTFGSLLDFKFHSIALGKRLKTIAFNRGEMDENIFAPFLLDEAESFTVVEPLDCAFCQLIPPFSKETCFLQCLTHSLHQEQQGKQAGSKARQHLNPVGLRILGSWRRHLESEFESGVSRLFLLIHSLQQEQQDKGSGGSH